MRTRQVRLAVLAALAGLTLASAGAARAGNIIGVDFTNGSATGQSPATTDVVGPYASAGWYNELDVSNGGADTITLTDSTNTATTGTFNFNQGGNTLSGNPIYNSSYGAAGAASAIYTPNQQLYNGTVQAASADPTPPNPKNWSQELVLKNIPYTSYSVYLLVHAPQAGPANVNVVGSVENFNGGVGAGAGTTYYFENTDSDENTNGPPNPLTYIQATSTSLGSPTAGASYVEFTGLTNPNETFDFANLTDYTQSYNNNVTLGAIEIVDTSGSSVPEPASLSLLAASGALLLLRRRRATA